MIVLTQYMFIYRKDVSGEVSNSAGTMADVVTCPHDVTTCPSTKLIKNLLIKLDAAVQSHKLKSDVVSDLKDKGHTNEYIENAMNDAKMRMKWDVGSRCLVNSRSKRQLFDGEITNSYFDDDNKEWMTVQYGTNQTKRIQRFCSDLRPIGDQNDGYEFNDEVMQNIRNSMRNSAGAISQILGEYHDQATQLVDALHHLKGVHDLKNDDTKFDKVHDLIQDAMTEHKCKIDDCFFVHGHYRDREKSDHKAYTVRFGNGVRDRVLMDIMAMIHCYFVHSYNIDRMTKVERIELDKASDIVVQENDEDQLVQHESDRTNLIRKIMATKQESMKKLALSKDIGRYNDGDDEGDMMADQLVDLQEMAKKVGVDEVVVREGLSDYEKNRDLLIGDLIDVVYGEFSEKTSIWSKINVDDDRKMTIFQESLLKYFKCTDLNTENFVKMCQYVISRRALDIDSDAFIEVAIENELDGRIFDRKNRKTFKNQGVFTKMFVSIPNYKGNPVRSLYGTMKKWKYVEMKEVKLEVKAPEEEQDAKEMEDETEKKGDDEPDMIPIYEVGKRFYFWNSRRKQPNFIAAKWKNVEEEVLNGPMSNFVSKRVWDELTENVNIYIKTKDARKIKSNGDYFELYGIAAAMRFDTEHLRALKMYTNLSEFCKEFCAILRRGNATEIAEIAHFTRTLVETVQCYGRPHNPKTKVYRGVGRTFLIESFSMRFHLPLSTTSDVTFPRSICIFIYIGPLLSLNLKLFLMSYIDVVGYRRIGAPTYELVDIQISLAGPCIAFILVPSVITECPNDRCVCPV